MPTFSAKDAWPEYLRALYEMRGLTPPDAKAMDRLTDQEVMAALRSDTPLNRARRIFSAAYAGIEQEAMQRKPAGPIEIRRMEFEAVQKIAAALSSGGMVSRQQIMSLIEAEIPLWSEDTPPRHALSVLWGKIRDIP